MEIRIIPEVYEPSEDTFQLIENIKIKKNDLVLELGTGCGIIALYCALYGANVVCSDINHHSINLTKENYKKNRLLLKGIIEVRYGDLFSVVKNNEKFDVIIFNLPYLPTTPDERVGESGYFDLATDGGIDGLKLIKRYVMDLSKYIINGGKAYFIFSSLSNRKELENILSEKGLSAKIESSYLYNDERLDVYCIYF